MRSALILALLAAGTLAADVAWANPELAKKAGCIKCHAVDKKKEGPAFQDSAKKFKAEADPAAAMYKSITNRSGEHPELKASPDDIKAVLSWVTSL